MRNQQNFLILNAEGLLVCRPVIASARDKRGLIKIVKKIEHKLSSMSLTNLMKQLIYPVSSSTVRRYLHELGYYGRAGLRKPLIKVVSSLNKDPRSINTNKLGKVLIDIIFSYFIHS
ncbi:481_t:CDS:2 [Entrophospora sp. SA101]|nr:481_t:CDS:2 [Entrophospora sp. SA101]